MHFGKRKKKEKTLISTRPLGAHLNALPRTRPAGFQPQPPPPPCISPSLPLLSLPPPLFSPMLSLQRARTREPCSDRPQRRARQHPAPRRRDPRASTQRPGALCPTPLPRDRATRPRSATRARPTTMPRRSECPTARNQAAEPPSQADPRPFFFSALMEHHCFRFSLPPLLFMKPTHLWRHYRPFPLPGRLFLSLLLSIKG
jgi:hypothetical protein